MTKHIEEIKVSAFRGLRDLHLENLNHVNIILGSNNAGKTSVLEAIDFFCHHTEAGVLTLARQRDKWRGTAKNKLTDIESVKCLFPVKKSVDSTGEGIVIYGDAPNLGQYTLSGRYTERKVISPSQPTLMSTEEDEEIANEEEIVELEVILTKEVEGDSTDQRFVFLDGERRRLYKGERSLPLYTIHAIDHLVGNPFKELTKDKTAKDKSVELLRCFDPNIVDLRNVDEGNSRIIPMIEYEGAEDYIPLTLFGDGLKKTLTLLEGLLLSKGGVLLIDEYETALHTAIMKPVFQFLLNLAKDLNIQLFLTTHSIEAVDKLLDCDVTLEEINILCLHQEDKTYVQSTSGKQAKDDRQTYDLELRV